MTGIPQSMSMTFIDLKGSRRKHQLKNYADSAHPISLW
jgi:hypothetical protein